MSGIDFAAAALAATFGGVLGAVGTAFLSWTQVRDSLDNFRREIEALGTSGETARVRAAAENLWRDLGVLSAALARLKAMLRIR